MSTIVFGGAGFIGSNIVDQLLAMGHEVTVFDNFSEGRKENLTVGHPNLEIIKGDVRDRALVERACDHKKWVFHLAAMSRIQPSLEDPTYTFDQNVMGTINVLEGARRAGASRVIYSASSSAYGRKNKPPHNEDMPTDCLNPYSYSKRMGEEICKMYNDVYGLSTVSLRYFNVYGPKHQESGQYATVIAIFMKQKRHGKPMTIVGDGTKRRDFTFISDIVDANILAAMNKDVTGVFNIGTGKNYSINEVAKLIEGDTVNIEDRPFEAFSTLADNMKAKEQLGWEPKVNLEQGLKITDEWMRTVRPNVIIEV